MEIISKRHPFKFYLLAILINIFFLGIGSIFISASLRDNNDKGYVIFILFLLLTIYFDVLFIKNSQKIVLNKKGVSYKNKLHYWKDIVEIKLTGKSGFFFNTPTECAVLKFKDLQEIRIFDDLYSNSAEMKCFIQDFVVDKKENFEVVNHKNNFHDLKNEIFISYKGNAIFSFRGLFMWIFIFFLMFLPLKSSKLCINDFNFPIIFSIFWFVLNSFMMFYFQISKNYFIVKNHYFFWVFKIFKISEIKEIVFEQYGKQPNRLKIINNKFKTKVFSAGSLTDKTWMKMKTELESRNVLVRNECIPEN
ncbi:MAG: hypothetical protein H7250_09440 [Flavobacterium sp.]|nr:hypothetical protein [Flavobacterium sp.]